MLIGHNVVSLRPCVEVLYASTIAQIGEMLCLTEFVTW